MAVFSSITQYRDYYLILDVVEQSYSVEDNTSTLNWALYIKNSYARFNADFHFTVTIDGSLRAIYDGNVDTTNAGYYENRLLMAGSYTVPHNNDGTKSVYCYAECSGGGSYGPGSAECGGTLPLATIPRAATINSFSGNDIDTDFTVGYTKYVNDWTYYIRMSMSDDTQLDRAIYNTSGEVYRLPEEAKDIIYNAVGNNDTVVIKVVIETWNGGTKVGESTALTNTCNINRNVWLNVNGTWKRGIPHVKINGEWKKGIPYIKINGEWKKAI